MKVRVTDTMRQQLARLHLASRETGGVMVVPRMLSVDEWEQQCESHQRALMEWSSENHDGAEASNPVPESMTAEQERAFAHDMHASRHLDLTYEQKTAKAYAKAMGIYR